MKWSCLFTVVSVLSGVDAEAQTKEIPTRQAAKSSMHGKVYVGYQGWFNADGDGMNVSFRHYGGTRFAPGHATVEMWPDVSELSKEELYATPFENADGSTAHVFSSAHPKTVDRHFAWMKEYGIDGAFVQRFGSSVRRPERRKAIDAVLSNCRAAAKANAVEWALMYDLSGLRRGQIRTVVIEDFKRLVSKGIFKDQAYIRHRNRPLVAVWGVGFRDGRRYGVDECAELIDFLQNDPDCGGNAIMIGVPYWWRSLKRDAVDDAKLLELAASVDIVSPWAVGRYHSPDEVEPMVEDRMVPDLEWLSKREVDYLPVVFPGFSWTHLQATRGKQTEWNAIPRLGGRFLWSQATAVRRAGVDMVYVAMFDEIDEGTAIFKVTNKPPVGATKFLTYEGLPSDHYLWLTGEIGKLLRGEVGVKMPQRRSSGVKQGRR